MADAAEYQYELKQVRYMGGERGYREILVVEDPDRQCDRFIVHECGSDQDGELHRFSEWRSLEQADSAFGIWPDHSLGRVKSHPGFLRFVDLGHDIPWFLAEPDDIVSRDRAIQVRESADSA